MYGGCLLLQLLLGLHAVLEGLLMALFVPQALVTSHARCPHATCPHSPSLACGRCHPQLPVPKRLSPQNHSPPPAPSGTCPVPCPLSPRLLAASFTPTRVVAVWGAEEPSLWPGE